MASFGSTGKVKGINDPACGSYVVGVLVMDCAALEAGGTQIPMCEWLFQTKGYGAGHYVIGSRSLLMPEDAIRPA